METTDGSAAFGSMPDFTASACGTGTSAPGGTAELCGAASCSGTGGYPVYARNCGYVQYDKGEQDVYKRQGIMRRSVLCVYCRRTSARRQSGWKAVTTSTVSYTHLDVYKRQVHNAEYVGIQSAIQLSHDLEPDKINGQVIIIHLMNPSGFEHRTMSLVYEDGKNLNRVFPGSMLGTTAERIAYTVEREFFPFADYYIDLHCGDGFEGLVSYVYCLGNASAVSYTHLHPK